MNSSAWDNVRQSELHDLLTLAALAWVALVMDAKEVELSISTSGEIKLRELLISNARDREIAEKLFARFHFHVFRVLYESCT